MNDSNNKQYYDETGWYSPDELLNLANAIVMEDTGIAGSLAILSAVRSCNSLVLELKFFDYLEQFCRDNVPGYDDLKKQSKANLN